MFIETLQILLRFLLKLFGFGLKGIGEFEDDVEFRRKLNNKIRKEKIDDGLPLFDGTLQDVQAKSIVYVI